MHENRALNLLSLAKKGGNLVTGEEGVGAACHRGKVRLIICACDASENAARRARGWAESCSVPCVRPEGITKQALGAALGKAVCALAGITERKLAAAFVRALPDAETNYDGLLAQLERRPGRRHMGEKQLEVAE